LPLQLNWVENNPKIFEISGEKPSSNKIEIFDNLLKRAKAQYFNIDSLLKSCDHLDLAYNKYEVTSSKKEKFEEMLNFIYEKCQRQNVDLTNSVTKRKNLIGESPAVPKILNTSDRIEKIKEQKKKKEEDENKKKEEK